MSDPLKIIHYNARKSHSFRANAQIYATQPNTIVCLSEPPPFAILSEYWNAVYGEDNKQAAICAANSNNIQPVHTGDPCHVQIVLKDHGITIHCLYAKPDELPYTLKIEHLASHPSTRSILLGDLNMRLSTLGDTPNDRGLRLEQMLLESSWQVMNIPGHFTFLPQQRSVNGNPYPPGCIDITMVTEDLAPFCTWSLLPDYASSDHLPTVLEIDLLPLPQPSPDFIHIPTFIRLVSTLHPIHQYDSLPQQIQQIVQQSKRTITRSNRSFWQGPYHLMLEQQKANIKAMRRRLCKTSDSHQTQRQEVRADLKLAEADMKKLVRKAQATWYAAQMSGPSAMRNIQSSIKKHRYAGRTYVNALHDGHHLVTDPETVARSLFDHFLCDACSWRPCSWTPSNITDEHPITALEIKTAIDKQPNSSPGLDQINTKVLKAWHKSYPSFLTALFNSWFAGRAIQPDFKIASLVVITKTPEATPTLQNLRPLSMPNLIMRIYSRVLAARITFFLGYHTMYSPVQFAHRKDMSLNDAIHKIAAIPDWGMARKHMVFILCDIKGAFDSILHQAIFDQMVTRQIPNNIILAYCNLLVGRKIAMRQCPSITSLPIYRGVQQGDPSSALLFNLGIEDALNRTLDTFKPYVGLVTYADDATFCFDASSLHPDFPTSTSLITGILLTFSANLMQAGLLLNLQKTQVLAMAHSPTSSMEISLNNQAVKQVDRARILGLFFMSSTSTSKSVWYHIRTKTLAAIKAIKSVKRFLRMPYVKRSVKATVARSYVQSILLSTAFVWSQYASTRDLIRIISTVDRQLVIHSLRLPYSTPTAPAIALQETPPTVVLAYFENLAQRQKMKLGKPILQTARPPPAWIHPAVPKVQIADPISYSHHLPLEGVLYFTDASKHPGATCNGAAFVAFKPDGQYLTSMMARVAPEATVFQTECYAIRLALQHALYAKHGIPVTIITDCLSAINALRSTKTRCFQVASIYSSLLRAKYLGENIQIRWCKAHVGFAPNDLADALAKAAVNHASYQTLHTLPLTRHSLYNQMLPQLWVRTEEIYAKLPGGQTFRQFFPTAEKVRTHGKYFNYYSLRIYLGHGPWNFIANRLRPAIPALCGCKLEDQSMEHLIMRCPVVHQACQQELSSSGLDLHLQNGLDWQELTETDQIHIFIRDAAKKIVQIGHQMLDEADPLQLHSRDSLC